MASQQTAATEVKVKQVIGGSEYCGQIQGISEDQLDRTTVHTFFRWATHFWCLEGVAECVYEYGEEAVIC